MATESARPGGPQAHPTGRPGEPQTRPTGPLLQALTGYELGPMIGGGGMADVYVATQTGLARRVAVKVMKPWLAQDQEFVSRFAREARVCAKLTHPHVVQVYGLGTHDGRPCLVMEFLEGRTLADALEEHLMAVEDIIAIIRQVLDGLSAAHARGIVHRDIKPGNVFLCNEGDVKVMDFGIAQASDTTPLTSTGAPIGTPEYMSPEQVEGKKVDARSDIYAVGILLYKMLTGETPFTAETPIAILLMHVSKPPPEMPPYIPAWLREVVLKALAKRPEDRYASAKEMLAAMEAKTVSSPVSASSPRLPAGSNLKWVPPDGYESAYSGSHTLPGAAPETDARRTAAIVAALVAVMLLAVAAGYALMQGRRAVPPPAIRMPVATPPAAASVPDSPPDTMTTVPAPSPSQTPLPTPQTDETNDVRATVPNASLYGRSPLVSDDSSQAGTPQQNPAAPLPGRTPAQNPGTGPATGAYSPQGPASPVNGAVPPSAPTQPGAVPNGSPAPNGAPAPGGYGASANSPGEPGVAH